MTDESKSARRWGSSALVGAVLSILLPLIFGCGSTDVSNSTAVDDCSRVYRWEAKLVTPLASEGQYSVRVLLDGVDQGSCTIEKAKGEWVMPARGKDGPCGYSVDIHATASAGGPAGGVTPMSFQLTGVSALVGDATPPARVHLTISLAGEKLVDGETELRRDCGQLLGAVG